MPLDPHTWNDITDFWTPTIANGDLYCYGGQEFVPNGIQFHARRPVYKVFCPDTGSKISSGGYGWAFSISIGGSLSITIADTGYLFGAYMDPYNSGAFSQVIAGGGGKPASPGGLGLITSFVAWPSLSGSVGAGLGAYNANSPSVDGLFQRGNTATNNVPFFIDIADLAVSPRWATFGYQSSGGSLGPVASSQPDGSGIATRQHAHWVSVYPSNGFTASAVPAPVPVWTPLSTLSATLLNGNTGIRDVLRFLNMPPLARVSQSASQSLTSNTANTLTSLAAQYDSYTRFASNTYTVPMTGLYFVHGMVTCSNFSGELSAGVQINGTNYYGPRAKMPGSGYGSAAKTQIFSLNAGDTIKLIANPSASASTSASHPSRLVVLHVSCLGSPATATPPVPPDTTFRWAAGTPGDLSQLFNNRIANDLLFLTQRPYLMAYQSAAQTGIAQNTVTPVNLDTIAGIVHGDNGDNYNGWNGTAYTAQAAGWYLAVQESFLATPTQTSSPWVSAAFSPSPAGDTPWDEYQRWCMSTSSTAAPGAAAVSYYYLRPGDTLTPGVKTGNSSSSTISTAAGAGTQSHFEIVYLGE